MINRILALMFIGSLASLGCERDEEPMVGEPDRTNGEEVEVEPEDDPLDDDPDFDEDF